MAVVVLEKEANLTAITNSDFRNNIPFVDNVVYCTSNKPRRGHVQRHKPQHSGIRCYILSS